MQIVDPDFMNLQEKQFESITVPQSYTLYRLADTPKSRGYAPPSLEKSKINAKLSIGNFCVSDLFFKDVLLIAKSQDLIPQVDAFASKDNSVLPIYWSKHSNAFTKCWSNIVLWLNPPHSLFDMIIDKILQDDAEVIILVPIAFHEPWFINLGRITTYWWDIPFSETFLRNVNGSPFICHLRFRVIFFNAYGALKRQKDQALSDFYLITMLIKLVLLILTTSPSLRN